MAPDHLRQGTNADNARDKVNANRCNTGRANSKLVESDVKEIRRSNLKQKQLAEKYNVKIETISAIVRRISWKHV